ncbi:MAG: undecaprenyl-diphosphate phosphatase [Actinomycetota bacterium]|nr:undecaprenyl-diphosphate phosphatase [Actinomycetota bacterium]
MQILQAIVLGVVQGVAEFLPISSSGHLRLIEEGLGWDAFGLAFDTMLHVATLLAVIVYFRKDLFNMIRSAFSKDPDRAHDRKLAWLVVVATIPTGMIGLIGNDWFEGASMLMVGVAFLFTSAFLSLTESLSRRSLHDAEQLRIPGALGIGIAQGIAVMPGVSRAGATMAAGMSLGLDREQAARFSFLLSGPIILLAGAKQGLDVVLGSEPMPGLTVAIFGVMAASLTGYAAIAGLMAYLRRHSMWAFAAYTGILGSAVVLWQVIA